MPDLGLEGLAMESPRAFRLEEWELEPVAVRTRAESPLEISE